MLELFKWARTKYWILGLIVTLLYWFSGAFITWDLFWWINISEYRTFDRAMVLFWYVWLVSLSIFIFKLYSPYPSERTRPLKEIIADIKAQWKGPML